MAICFSGNPIGLDEVGSAGRGLDLEVGRNTGLAGFGVWMSPGVAQLTNQTPSKLVISNLERKPLWGMKTRQILDNSFIAFHHRTRIMSPEVE